MVAQKKFGVKHKNKTMNREIKFRAWNGNNMVDLYSTTKFALVTDLNIDGLFIPFHKDYTLMQFTGLKDKNGKEIYESDLVKVKLPDTIKVKGETIKGKIEYDNVACRYLINQFFDNSYGYDYFQIHEDLIIEVIGNIYENKPS